MNLFRRVANNKLGGTGWIAVALLALAMPPLSGGVYAGGEIQTIRGFEMPEFDRDNRLRSRLMGELARIMPSGQVDIEKMRIDFYDDNREVEMQVTAETCLYDRQSRNAESDTRVRIARQNMIITGKGFIWNADDGLFEIHEDAKVVIEGADRVGDTKKEGDGS